MLISRLTSCLFLVAAGLSAADSENTPTGSPPASTTEPVVELDKLVVHTTPFGHSADELAESVTVLAGPRLDAHRMPTLGETLDGAPGVSSTYFGPGASRPVIRGLGGERIRILTNGLGSADVSGTSPDHAVTLDPALIERIEVLRGPAALLYGTSAVGGLVNVVDHQVPAEKPATVAGFLEAGYGTGTDEKSANAHVGGPAGDVGWQVSFQRHKSDDIDIPGYATADPAAHDAPHGVLPNSAIDTTSGSAGTSWFWDAGFVGVAVSALDTRYGVPGDEKEEVQIDLEQRRADARAEITQPFAGFRSARFRFGTANYHHVELEGDEIGTRFDTDSWETRLDMLHNSIGPLEGAIGAQVQHSTLVAAGDEAFLPPTRTLSQALFALEEIPAGSIRWQFGARWESADVDTRNGSGIGRDFDELSTSAGGVWSIDEAWALAFSLAHTGRAPTAQELFANGPHAATHAFEIGDPDLGSEWSTGLDVSLRRRTGPITGALTVFVNDFDGYIAEVPTGEGIDGLPVYRYLAQDARFQGAELEATWHLHETGRSGLELTFTADTVRATNRTANEPLPRIPAARASVALSYENDRWTAGCEVRQTGSQTRVAGFEDSSDSYTLIGAYCGYRLPVGESAVQFFARASNLADEEARPHTSFLKDVAPLPGRNVTIGARWEL